MLHEETPCYAPDASIGERDLLWQFMELLLAGAEPSVFPTCAKVFYVHPSIDQQEHYTRLCPQ